MNADVSHLGELEMVVLEYVWEHGASDVKSAHRAFGQERGITHNTVQSTFKRLWTKKLMSRHKKGHAYIYAPRVDRGELTELLVGELVAETEMHVALEAFVNLADRAGADTLDTLEALIAAKRQASDDSK